MNVACSTLLEFLLTRLLRGVTEKFNDLIFPMVFLLTRLLRGVTYAV